MAFAACTIIDGHVYVYAQTLGGINNINIYNIDGELQWRTGNEANMQNIRTICETYDNFVDINKEVNLEEEIDDFDTYIEL